MGRKKSQRGGSSGRGSSSLKQKKASGIEQFGQSEVDAFHSSKDEVALSGGGAASGESEDESSDSSDWVMDDVNKGEDSEDEDDEQDLDSDAEEDRELKAWGKKKSKYYGADTHELDIEYDSDDAKDEEEEAKRLSKVQAKTLNNADFGLDDDEEEEDEDEEDQDLETRSKASGKNTGAGKQQQKKKDKTKAKAAKSAKKSSDASVETIQRDVSKMSREEKLQVLLNESPELLALLSEFKIKSKELHEKVNPLLKKLRDGEFPTSAGMRYLEMKQQVLLTYITHVSFYLLLKAEGRSVRDHPVIDSLVHIRTVMERMEPLDKRLRYQVDKLLKVAATGKLSSDAGRAALSHRPDLDQLMPLEDGDGEGAGRRGKDNAGDGVYRPPKLQAAHYEEERGKKAEDKKARQLKKRLAKNQMLRDMTADFSSAPEVVDQGRTQAEKEAAEFQRERQRYEEENMQRLTLTKAQKKKLNAARLARRPGGQLDVFDDVTDFDDLDKLRTSSSGSPGAAASSGLQAAIGAIANSQKKSRSGLAWQSTDAEVGLVDPEEARRLAGRFDPEEYERQQLEKAERKARGRRAKKTKALDLDTAGEDSFYAAVRDATTKKKRARAEAYEPKKMMTGAEPEVRGNQPRNASVKILKNRGLVPHRAKVYRNPRMVKKKKFEKAKKAIKGQIRQVRSEERGKAYTGEGTGISANVTHSRKARY